MNFLYLFIYRQKSYHILYKINYRMSFHGIRKYRDQKRDSPNLYQIDECFSPVLSLINPVIKSQSKTKDTDFKGDSTQRSRKNSIKPNLSNEKQKKFPLMGNFLHINLEGIRPLGSPSKKEGHIQQNTDRVRLYKNISDVSRSTQRDKDSDINLACFTRDFVVGKGGFGKVWKVHQKKTNKVYAMKEMLKAKIITKKSVHSVLNEKQLLRKLKHPFLVNMIYSFQNKECIFLIMDYCNRGDLRYHLGNRRKFNQQQTRFFISCILLCLQYLHSNRIIHRDLKPQNLVFDQKGYLRVTDLGVSKQYVPNNFQDTSGTPGYMSPEVICKMNHSYPVDFFALGVIAYELMTGKRPYLGQNRKQIREKILSKQIQLDEIPPYGWSRQSVDFINRLIQRKPENRLGYQQIDEIKKHSWLRKVQWNSLSQRKIKAPFLPPTIEEDYHNYQECISEDTQIADLQEYNLLLRHPDTQKAFEGYQNNTKSPRKKSKELSDLDSFLHTSNRFQRK